MEKQHLLKFGSFALNADQSVLELDGKAVSITPKMFDTLHVLVRNPGRIVEKDTLLREVWPDSFVEDGNIAFNIRQLRKALGDSAQSPTFIETVPKRGYRFIAEVETVENLPKAVGTTGSVASARPLNTRGLLLGGGIFLAILLLALYVYLPVGGSNQPPILTTPFSAEKLSADGNAYHAILSPDGKKIYYTHRDGSGGQSLWMRQIETATTLQILPPSDDFYGGIDVSPDGETLYFVRGIKGNTQTDIYKMPSIGGIPTKIIDATQGWMGISPDGSKISFVRCPYTEEEHCALYIADTNGKNERKLASRPRPIRIADNQISPDGRKLAFAAGQSRTASNEFGLFEVDLASGQERRVTEEKFFNIAYLSYLSDQKNILMTAMQRPDSSYPIWKISTSDGTATRLINDSETYSRISLNAASSLLLATRVTPDFRLYLHSTGDPSAPPRPLANAGTVSFAPGGRVVFSSVMTGNSEIWSVNADGSDQRQLTNDPSGDLAPIVSPDGKYIYFSSDRTGVLHAWRMNADGTDTVQITTEEGGYPLLATTDGKWLFYRSGLSSTIRRVDVATGKEEQVAGDLGHCMTVSPDASTIAYSKRDGSETSIFLYSISGQRITGSFKIAVPHRNVRQIAWTAAGDTIAYLLTDDKKENGRLYYQPVNGGPPKEIADLQGDSIAEMSALALSPDGLSFGVIKGNWEHDAFLIKGLK